MKIRIFSTLLLLILILQTNLNVLAFDNEDTNSKSICYTVNQNTQLRTNNDNDIIIEKLKENIPVAIYADNIDIIKLIPLFEKLKLPIILSLEDSIKLDKLENPEFEIDLPEMSKNDLTKTQDFLKLNKNNTKELVYIINLVPIDNKIQVELKSIKHKKNKSLNELIDLSKNILKNTDVEKQLVNFKRQTQDENKLKSSSRNMLLDSIRKTVSDYDDFYFAGHTFTNLKVCESIIDYRITKWDDSNSNYDFITFEALADLKTYEYLNQGHPPYATKKYVTKMDNYYSSDKLIEYGPNNSFETIDEGTPFNITIGYPASISISFEWNGKDNVDFEAEGDKATGFYYNIFERPAGISNYIASHKFATMYKMKSNRPYKVFVNTYVGIGVQNYTMDYDTYNKDDWSTIIVYH